MLWCLIKHRDKFYLSVCQSINQSISQWLYSPLLDLGRFFSFLIFYTVTRAFWMGDQPVSRPLPAHRTVQTQNKRTQTSMPQLGFEPTILVFERAKTIHALDSAATVPHICIYLSVFLSISVCHVYSFFGHISLILIFYFHSLLGIFLSLSLFIVFLPWWFTSWISRIWNITLECHFTSVVARF
jgi:hypothetical protein